MLFKDIALTRYSIFNRLSEPKRSEQVDAVKYIQMIAATSGIDISRWDCQDVFGDGKGVSSIITDKKQINKKFFERCDELRRESPVQEVYESVDELSKRNIDEISKRYMLDVAARVENDITAMLRRAKEYYDSAESVLREAAQRRASISSCPAQRPPSLGTQIQEVSNSSQWVYIGLRGDSVVFRTRNDVILKHKNQAAGIDVTVNFGKFDVLYSLETFLVKVKPVENNIFVHDYYHPHVNYAGAVCWGSASDTVSKALSNLNFTQVMTILASVLNSYNADNPYKPIEVFDKEFKRLEFEAAQDALAAVQQIQESSPDVSDIVQL